MISNQKLVWFSFPIQNQLAEQLQINFVIILSQIVFKTIVYSTTKVYLSQIKSLSSNQKSYAQLSLVYQPFFIAFSLENLIILFWIQFISTIYLTLILIKNVINQITTYLNISCFKIKKKQN
ncbi:unnamed protein product [Paramecium sonneborni]|uniref:Transmembrane protein n=1 Tax=Paramecium sonneborni TaxID=65129 RepID=A0A8S1QL39_9CILI|nr:unnamed protein product [Paramecium sonneborni]